VRARLNEEFAVWKKDTYDTVFKAEVAKIENSLAKSEGPSVPKFSKEERAIIDKQATDAARLRMGKLEAEKEAQNAHEVQTLMNKAYVFLDLMHSLHKNLSVGGMARSC
jgi:hypothetical protein